MGIQTESSLETLKQNLFTYIRHQLGDGIIDIELDSEHYETALSFYNRQLSSTSTKCLRRKLQFYGACDQR